MPHGEQKQSTTTTTTTTTKAGITPIIQTNADAG